MHTGVTVEYFINYNVMYMYMYVTSSGTTMDNQPTTKINLTK